MLINIFICIISFSFFATASSYDSIPKSNSKNSISPIKNSINPATIESIYISSYSSNESDQSKKDDIIQKPLSPTPYPQENVTLPKFNALMQESKFYDKVFTNDIKYKDACTMIEQINRKDAQTLTDKLNFKDVGILTDVEPQKQKTYNNISSNYFANCDKIIESFSLLSDSFDFTNIKVKNSFAQNISYQSYKNQIFAFNIVNYGAVLKNCNKGFEITRSDATRSYLQNYDINVFLHKENLIYKIKTGRSKIKYFDIRSQNYFIGSDIILIKNYDIVYLTLGSKYQINFLKHKRKDHTANKITSNLFVFSGVALNPKPFSVGYKFSFDINKPFKILKSFDFGIKHKINQQTKINIGIQKNQYGDIKNHKIYFKIIAEI